MPAVPLEITVEEVKGLRDKGTALRLIDVREPEEFRIARIDGTELIPMRSIPQQLEDFQDCEVPLIVFCHHGVRSLQAAAWLRERGVDGVQSMAGGIEDWSLRIDPAVPRY